MWGKKDKPKLLCFLDHRHGSGVGGRGNHDAVVAGLVGHIPQAATAGPSEPHLGGAS